MLGKREELIGFQNKGEREAYNNGRAAAFSNLNTNYIPASKALWGAYKHGVLDGKAELDLAREIAGE